MSAPADIDDPFEAQLARLAALDLSAVEKVHARLMAAEDDGAVADLGRTYQRLARSLRQTLALKARLKREREQAERLAATQPLPPPKPGGVAVAKRLREVRQAMHRILWNEHEREPETCDWDEYEQLVYEMETTVTDELMRDSFCVEPLDDHVARLCLELGLSPEAAETWRDLPDPPKGAIRDDADFQDST